VLNILALNTIAFSNGSTCDRYATDWAWVNVPELIELRKVSAIICCQRRFRTRMDMKKETERSRRLQGFGVKALAKQLSKGRHNRNKGKNDATGENESLPE
jgi:hypothetical protein